MLVFYPRAGTGSPLGMLQRRCGSSRRQFSFQRSFSCEGAYSENTKANDIAISVNAFHHGVVGSFLHVTGRFLELHFKVISFAIKPNFYFVCHKSSPAFGLLVRYAVTTKASPAAYLITTQTHLPPTIGAELIKHPHVGIRTGTSHKVRSI